MTDYSLYALKEWSVTVDSLLAGQQILLLRKGGIHEQRDGFHLEHTEFFLFPTHVHQSKHALFHSSQPRFDSLKGHSSPTVILNIYGEVHQLLPLTSLDTLRALDGLHRLDWTTVEQRFFYRNRPGLNLLLLRIYRLHASHEIRNLELYDGGVSWVELEKPLSLAGAKPVLDDDACEEHLERIRQRAGAASSVGSTLRQKCC
jgi:hypothetical protein